MNDAQLIIETEKKVVNIISKHFSIHVPTITPDSTLDSLGISSLSFMEIYIDLNTTYPEKFNLSQLNTKKTVKELVEYATKKI